MSNRKGGRRAGRQKQPAHRGKAAKVPKPRRAAQPARAATPGRAPPPAKVVAALQPTRPKLSARAASARASARRFHERLRRERERRPSDLSNAAREQRRLVLLSGAGAIAVLTLWCSTRVVPLIEADVESALGNWLRSERIDWVQADVFGRQVRLFGVAPSPAARAHVVASIEALDAVVMARDHLVVRSLADAPEGGEAPGRPGARASRLEFAFDGSQLTVSGSIGGERRTTALLRRAEKRFSRDAVVSELMLAEESPGDWEGAADAALRALALLGAGRAVVQNGRLTVAGVAPDATTLGSVRDVMDTHAPQSTRLRADVVPLYRRGRLDGAACEKALGILLGAGDLSPSGDFSGLTAKTRTTLDQIARLMQSCAAGVLVVVSPAANEDDAVQRRLFAEDVRQYLAERAPAADTVAVAETMDEIATATGVALRLVLSDQPTG